MGKGDSEYANPEEGPNGELLWTVAGYLDWSGEYHDLEDTDFQELGDSIYSEMDLVTISWIDAEQGTTQYARLEGPWEDYEDLSDVVDTYFEDGTV